MKGLAYIKIRESLSNIDWEEAGMIMDKIHKERLDVRYEPETHKIAVSSPCRYCGAMQKQAIWTKLEGGAKAEGNLACRECGKWR